MRDDDKPQDMTTAYAAHGDDWLMSRIANGDVRAYETLVGRYLDRFVGFAERVTGVRSEAEDILQEAFLRVWTRAASWSPQGARFTTWFYRIVLNLCIDYKRRKRPEALPDGYDAVDGGQSAEAQLSDTQASALVAAALNDLPRRQKAAIGLCYYEGMSNAEAAEILSVGIKGLESLLVRGRRQLADRLKTRKAYLLEESL